MQLHSTAAWLLDAAFNESVDFKRVSKLFVLIFYFRKHEWQVCSVEFGGFS